MGCPRTYFMCSWKHTFLSLQKLFVQIELLCHKTNSADIPSTKFISKERIVMKEKLNQNVFKAELQLTLPFRNGSFHGIVPFKLLLFWHAINSILKNNFCHIMSWLKTYEISLPLVPLSNNIHLCCSENLL